jgi:iron complex transport system ATP-binding protein
MTRLSARGIVVRYNGMVAVDGVDLDVAASEWVALIGPNGAGKSSLLRALAGIIPYEGSVRLGGTAVEDLARRDVARLVAVVPQHPMLPEGMRVVDYVLLGRTPHLGYLAVESQADVAAAHGALERLDASGWSSPERSPRSPRCCSSTSRPHPSTSVTASRCSTSSTSCGSNGGWPWRRPCTI